MDNTTIITSQGNTTIPVIYRNKLGYTQGVRVYWYELEGLLIISKEKLDDISTLIVD